MKAEEQGVEYRQDKHAQMKKGVGASRVYCEIFLFGLFAAHKNDGGVRDLY